MIHDYRFSVATRGSTTLTVAVVCVVLPVALWWGIGKLFDASDPPDKDELALPAVETSAVQALDRGSTRKEVFDAIGKGKLVIPEPLTRSKRGSDMDEPREASDLDQVVQRLKATERDEVKAVPAQWRERD